MKLHRIATFTLAALSVSAATAGMQVQYLGSGNGEGRGGEYLWKVVGDQDLPGHGIGTEFTSFALEVGDHVRAGRTYEVAISDRAIGMARTEEHTTDDPLSDATAWLYMKYMTDPAGLGIGSSQTFDGYYGDDRTVDLTDIGGAANGLQLAIWRLEDEIRNSRRDAYGQYDGRLREFSEGDRLAADWFYRLAVSSGWRNNGAVVVMNVTDDNGVSYQDQMVLTGAPAPDAALLAVLGLAAAAGMRRKA